VGPATGPTREGGTEQYKFVGGEAAASIKSAHPSFLRIGWGFLIAGFLLQFAMEAKD
jgi:hypothetical protein